MRTVCGKVVVLGLQGVGKTTTVTRYIQKTFIQTKTPTIGASFFSCKVEISDVCVKLQIWDTAGQERFKAMAPMFYRNANAALLLFDITNYDSFESMKGWVQELRRNVFETMLLCVVGNKIDLHDMRKVSKDEALQYANSIGATYHEVSAKTDQGVGLVFEFIAHELIKLSGEDLNHTLKVYENVEDHEVNKSSEQLATETGVVENVNLGIDSIAHGKSIRSKCC
ncbi:RAS oncogene family member RabX1 [Rhynchophorus ferrugineus]|uniref:RAS oncogene family member RabX1 n=1 Tax=Rhynchophorus ferrugineus TaxID=354439 RepID=UPI003FCCD0BF